MIISDRYRFTFVHIPKCAGTSVRKALEQFNEWKHAGPPWCINHPQAGLLDYGHIPLFALRDYFAQDFKKLRDYLSFAVIRDPFARFPSSISQRFLMYGDQPIQKQDRTNIQAEIERTIDFLVEQPPHNNLLPAEYIHFQKQGDYIRVDGEAVVDIIYTVDEIGRLMDNIGARVGYDFRSADAEDLPPRANRALGHRNEPLRLLVEYTRPVTRWVSRALPDNTRKKLQSVVYVPRDQRLSSLFASDYVKDFIRDYYREDIDLWNEFAQSTTAGKERLS